MSKRIKIISFLQFVIILLMLVLHSEEVFSNALNVLDQPKEVVNKEGNLNEPAKTSNYRVDTAQIIENENIKEEEIPSSTTFIPWDKEDGFDLSELQENVIYPDLAIKSLIEGKVIVSVFVDKKGKVKKTEILSTDSNFLNQAAIDAVTKTAFTPATQKNQPIGCWVSIPIIFKLK